MQPPVVGSVSAWAICLSFFLQLAQLHPCCATRGQGRRPERNGSLRILYAARISHCRACSLREQCQESATTIKARQVSAVYWPLPSHFSVSSESSPAPEEFSPPSVPHPVLWGDWQRCFHRQEVVKLLRHQRVDIELAETAPPALPSPARPPFPCRASTLSPFLGAASGTQCSPENRAIGLHQALWHTRCLCHLSRSSHCLSFTLPEPGSIPHS